MQIQNCHIFTATPELADLAVKAGQAYLAEPAAWTARISDRTGDEVAPSQLKQAFWTVFTAQLVPDESSEPGLDAFRRACLELTFDGCWKHSQVKFLGPVQDLLQEAATADLFLAEHAQQ